MARFFFLFAPSLSLCIHSQANFSCEYYLNTNTVNVKNYVKQISIGRFRGLSIGIFEADYIIKANNYTRISKANTLKQTITVML